MLILDKLDVPANGNNSKNMVLLVLGFQTREVPLQLIFGFVPRRSGTFSRQPLALNDQKMGFFAVLVIVKD